MEKQMKYIPLVAQIFALTMAAISRRPDAMGYAAMFAVLCVAVVLIGKISATSNRKANRI